MFIGLLRRGRQLQSPNPPETGYDPTAAAQKPSTVPIENAETSEVPGLFIQKSFTHWSCYVLATSPRAG
jgi:hypothetical protein